MMNTMMPTFLAAILMSAATACAAADDGSASLTLEIGGVAPSEGFVMVGVYDSEAGWNDGSAVAGARAEAQGDQITAVFDDLAPGSYGVKMYHDVNANGEMDTNLMGIPNEPFAFSNNARGRFGPPSWADAVFEVGADGTVHSIRFE